MFYNIYFVKFEYFFVSFFLSKFQIVLQSLNSPKFENMLLGYNLCRTC